MKALETRATSPSACPCASPPLLPSRLESTTSLVLPQGLCTCSPRLLTTGSMSGLGAQRPPLVPNLEKALPSSLPQLHNSSHNASLYIYLLIYLPVFFGCVFYLSEVRATSYLPRFPEHGKYSVHSFAHSFIGSHVYQMLVLCQMP